MTAENEARLKAMFAFTPHTPESSKAAKEAFEAQHPMLKGMDWELFAHEVNKTGPYAPRTGKEPT